MKKNVFIFVFFILAKAVVFAQNPVCPSPYVYMDGSGFIRFYDPSQPLSATNPSNTNIPTFGGGLTLMPNISGGTLSPTFYSTAGGTYWYWSGAAWVNTGHSTGSAGSAVNIGGCGSYIFNLAGSSGQVYIYNGATSGTLLTTLANFNGGGPYDLVTDCNCNFYALKTTTANGGQSLSMYNSAGVLQNTLALINMPNASAGGGFAIIGNTVYLRNTGFYIGTISGGAVTFTPVAGFSASVGDFASCPNGTNANPQQTITASISGGGPLSCFVPTVNISVTTTASPVTYAWSGAGIVGPSSGSAIVANAAGIYTCVVSTLGCSASQTVVTYSLANITSSVSAVITPSGNICTNSTGTLQLQISSSNSINSISWSGPGIISGITSSSIITNAPGLYSVSVTNLTNGCVDSDTVIINPTPTVTAILSSPTICAQGLNGSLASLTITASGALNYTLATSPNYSTTSVNGPVMPCFPLAPFNNSISVATASVFGTSGFCSSYSVYNFSIFPNPNIAVSPNPASVCLGKLQPFSGTGATTYTWSGPAGLNVYSGSYVVANTTVTSIYSVIGNSLGCNSATENATLNILPIPSVSVSPQSSTICAGSSVTLTAGGTAYSFTWSPFVGLSNNGGYSVSASPQVTKVYTILGQLNSCTNVATAIVNVVNPPTISLFLNSNKLCQYNYHGSTNTISANAFGATSYTLLSGSNFFVNSPTGSSFQITPTGPLLTNTALATTTLIGNLSVCTVTLSKSFTIVPNPLLTISPSSTVICPGKSQVFHASGAITYTWLPSADLSTTTGNLVLATPNISNIYSVYGNSVGCNSDTYNANLIVLPLPIVSVAPSSPTICSGNSTTLVVSGNANFYNWYPPTNLSNATGTSVVASPLVTQSYTVVGTVNNCTNSAISTVSAIVVPVLTATASQYTVCSGATTVLKAFGANTFYWTPSQNLNYTNGSVVNASPDHNTTYTVNGFNGICTGSTTISIETIPLPNMGIVTSENQICIGSTLTIIAKGAETYSWSPNIGLSNTTGSFVLASPPSNTNYTIVGSNSHGTLMCQQKIGYSVLVVPLTQASVSNSVAICKGAKTTLYASGGNSYKWAPSFGLNITNGSGVVASPSVSTSYTVDVSQNSFCGNTVTVFVKVNPNPTVFAGRDTIYNLDEQMFLNATATGTLNWISGEGIVCKVCPVTQIKINRDECYVVETTNEYGCKAQDKICVQVTDEFGVFIPNSFTPNEDKINDVFYVYGNNIFDFKLDIFDRWGALLFSSGDQLIGWDGTYKSKLCKNDSYVYKVEFKGINGKHYVKNGDVRLIK